MVDTVCQKLVFFCLFAGYRNGRHYRRHCSQASARLRENLVCFLFSGPAILGGTSQNGVCDVLILVFGAMVSYSPEPKKKLNPPKMGSKSDESVNIFRVFFRIGFGFLGKQRNKVHCWPGESELLRANEQHRMDKKPAYNESHARTQRRSAAARKGGRHGRWFCATQAISPRHGPCGVARS